MVRRLPPAPFLPAEAGSAAELALLADLPGLAVGQFDTATGRYVFVNRALCELTGYGPEELLERSFLELTHPEERERDRGLLDSIRRGELPSWRVEKRLLRKDGEAVWVQVGGRAILDDAGRPVRTLSVFVDIEARKAAEDRLEAMLASIHDHLASYDPAWRFSYVNDAAAAVLGKPKEELLGRSIWELFPDAVGNDYYRQLHQAVAEKRVIRSEFYYAPFDKWFENHIYPTATGVTVFSADVSWRKRAEALQRDAERRKDEFLAALSHELRNPLAAILAAARSMATLDPAAAGAAAGYRRAAAAITRQGELLVRLVDDLLDVSRITRGKIELRREPTDLASAVERAVETVRPLLDERGHELVIALPAEPLVLDADAARLVQALGNVLHNAAKFTPPGGHVAISARVVGDEVEIAVRDDGPGIAPDQLERVFEIFEQGELATASRGLGIGLTLVRRLVELHNGRVAARSAGAGTGTQIVLWLPRASAPPAAPAEAPRAAAAPPRRILVVDDNVDAAESLALLLDALGHRAQVARGGLEALALAPDFVPDVVLLDLDMPDLDGYQVATRLRAVPALERTRVVALTGWGHARRRARSAELGFDDYLLKPIGPAELDALLAEPRAESRGREGSTRLDPD